MAFIKMVHTLSAPFLKNLEKSFSSLGNTHVLGRAVGNETRSYKVVDCFVGVNLCEGKEMIGQDLIDKAIDALHKATKATKANKSSSVSYQDTINELDKSLTGLEDILRGAEDQDGIGAMCTRLTDANVQYKKLPDGTKLGVGLGELASGYVHRHAKVYCSSTAT
ncbi:hypothetical protein BGZ59_003971 [Podila verticillata]|nr:hypothetical protein BGZ59_003971 [Podila verticillata]